ncbi:MAG: AMIN domain-containing protein [Myxococcales bacterium]
MLRIPFILAVLPAVALAQERARLLEVRAGGDAAASSIELLGDRPLSFTTLKLTSPPRVVVDLADTEVAPEAREVAVEDGTVNRVAAAAAGQRTARVVIELAAEAEFDVRAHANSVEVRIPRLAPLVAAAEPPPAAVEPVRSPSLPASEPVAAPRASDAAAAPPPTVDPAAEERREARAAAAQPEAAAKLATAKQAAARRAAEQKAAAERKAPAVAVAAAEKTAAKGKPLAEKARKPATPQRKIAMVQRDAITGIGFRPIEGGEVIVRSDHPLEYGVSGEGNAVLLHLPGANIPLPNNRRPLDTHYFGGRVQRVVPLAKENGTDVRIELNGHADYQLAQSGTVLTVTFSASR